MLKAAYCPYRLLFKEPATTSRETMTHKDTYFIKLWDDARPSVYGLGECALFRGLGADDRPDYLEELHALCHHINITGEYDEPEYSSIRFGLETAAGDLRGGGQRIIYPSSWTGGESEILINGLVWMGTIDQMKRRVAEKIEKGFRCIKFKIGGQDFERELSLLRQLREAYPEPELEIRLDANGAFTPANALAKLQQLAQIGVHSIEQPIKPRQWEELSNICARSPISIALDEELIGIDSRAHKEELLAMVKPQYVILKPSLCGGISGATEWIDVAQAHGIGWWVTSALESNVGLNMLAQWVATLGVTMPQGLGTGSLYLNNIPSPLRQVDQGIIYDVDRQWEIPQMQWIEP